MKKYLSNLSTLVLNFSFFIILLVSLNSLAELTIVPIKVNISKSNKIATMTLQNNDYMPKKFQLTLKKREYIKGKEEYVETKDLVATPGMFTLQGNKIQLIRIALKNTENFSRKENDYRIEIRELPQRIKIDNNITSTLNFVVQLNIPITVSS
ncbi:MAG TPA: fimbria/pilus periplasmic chaperone [Rickettsia endosymbiont of Omalisus fontisbellaquei]|jgi:fimbrial chaperone protein|nr:fimbria/pilus periplasmic chaperone [Rickettsia endosymbiont of Omalisus fontisbellaquei]